MGSVIYLVNVERYMVSDTFLPGYYSNNDINSFITTEEEEKIIDEFLEGISTIDRITYTELYYKLLNYFKINNNILHEFEAAGSDADQIIPIYIRKWKCCRK